MLQKTSSAHFENNTINDHRLLVRVRLNISQITAIFDRDGRWEQVRFQKMTPEGRVYRDEIYSPGALDIENFTRDDHVKPLVAKFIKATSRPQHNKPPELEEQIRRLQSHKYRLVTRERFSSLNELDENWAFQKD